MTNFSHQTVDVAGMTFPTMEEFPHVTTIGEFIDHCARVSNPGNQKLPPESDKLLKYLIRNEHWSPFEMASITMKIVTTRDIARQMLRHRSFSFQEFSQRYAEVKNPFVCREARLQDTQNRQNSIDTDELDIHDNWTFEQQVVGRIVADAYKRALENGIAKEQARVILPEGMTPSTLYMAGNVRSWVHYCKLRSSNGTQKEHMDIANKATDSLIGEVPELRGYFYESELSETD